MIPYFDVVEKYIERWFNQGWLFYGIIGLSVFAVYVLFRVVFQ